MARARIEAGWVIVDVPGVDPLVPVEIGIGDFAPVAAFRDGVEARVPVPADLVPGRSAAVILVVAGHAERIGNLHL